MVTTVPRARKAPTNSARRNTLHHPQSAADLTNATAAELSRRRDNWRDFSTAIAAPHFELTAEEFAAILSTYKALRDAGDTFDPMLVALMTVLERQAAETVAGFEDDADGDADASDGQEWGNR